jgi:Nucleoside 2-deoxyribosyltransferase
MRLLKLKVIKNIGHGKQVYFAAPMFSASEREYNLKVTKVLEEFGYKVFLPQRDGIEAARLDGKKEEELVKMIFPLDVGEVKKADIVFMNIDGRAPDEGACVELGIAYGVGKRCYGFKTDPRTVELSLEMNPMISGCMIKNL